MVEIIRKEIFQVLTLMNIEEWLMIYPDTEMISVVAITVAREDT